MSTSCVVPRIREILTSWLMDDHADLNRLTEWLQGYDIAAGGESEPYTILLEGLREIDRDLERVFTARVRDLLQTNPDVFPFPDKPEEGMYNLLRLCHALAQPDLLGEPLYAMFRRQALSMNFRGMDLRIMLRDALVSNQKDNSLLPAWEAMTDGKSRSGFLPGDVRHGIEGILWMPISEDRPDNPDEDALGRALEKFAAYLEKDTERENIFMETLHRIAERWGSRMWEVFPGISDDHNWPAWASDLTVLAVNFLYRDPPEKTPVMGPYLLTIAALQREMTKATTEAERERYSSAIRDITRRVLEDPVLSNFRLRISERDRLARENYISNSMENEFRGRGEAEIAELIESARRQYMVERGTLTPIVYPASSFLDSRLSIRGNALPEHTF